MQPGQDQLDAGNLLLRMHVDRHAAAVVVHLDRLVLEQGDGDLVRVARQGLVDTVVDDFVDEMVGPAGVGVHPRPAAHGVEARQYLDVGCGIGLAHRARGS
jgi:hypothetical protein